MFKVFKGLFCRTLAVSLLFAAPFQAGVRAIGEQIQLQEQRQVQDHVSRYFLPAVLSDEEVEEIAQQLYSTARAVWHAAKEANDPLAAELDLAHIGNINKLIRKYHTPTYDGLPRVVSHEEFEALSQGETIYYRGLHCQDNLGGTTTYARVFAHALKHGEFHGFHNGGLYFAKADADGDHGFGYASFFACFYHGCLGDTKETEGVVCRAIIDPELTINIPTVEDLDRIKLAYKEYMPEIFDSLTSRDALAAVEPEHLLYTLGLNMKMGTREVLLTKEDGTEICIGRCPRFLLDGNDEATVWNNAIACLLGHVIHPAGLGGSVDLGTEAEIFDRSALIFDADDIQIPFNPAE